MLPLGIEVKPFDSASGREAFMMVFFRVGWMDRYQGLGSGDSIHRGGAFVDERGFGHEICNFSPCNGRVYGFVQPPGSHPSESERRINIDRLGARKDDDSISGVLVLWVASRPADGPVIVGWYKNATVFRNWQPAPAGSKRRHDGNEFGYFASAIAQDATLLPLDERLLKVPKGKGAMGQSNIWYANQASGDFIRDVESLVSCVLNSQNK